MRKLLTNVNKNFSVRQGLLALGLSEREAAIYLELLRRPLSYVDLSYATGINRTTLYRLIAGLEKRALITHRIDDQGRRLAAVSPNSLEATVVVQEEQAKRQRAALTAIMPDLTSLELTHATDFAVRTYEGVEGFKRMLWHELKTQGHCLCISRGSLEDLVPDKRWAERHRRNNVEAGYTILELGNPGTIPADFTKEKAFVANNYELRLVDKSVITIGWHLMGIYNDTVATYNIFGDKRVGIEVQSKTYAETMRTLFYHLWEHAQEATSRRET